MTEVKKNDEMIMSNRPELGDNKPLSDEVIIEIVHAFMDITIEFINRKYQSSANK